MRSAFPALLAAALLAGCVAQGPFPSLAPRPDELMAIEEPVREAPRAADDAALRTRVAALLEEVRAGARGFDADHEAARRAAARSGPTGSDAWVEAQQAISRLEAARGRTMAAAAELHQLALDRADVPTSDEDRRLIEAAIAEADRVAAGQQARIDRLR
jgi:hypothetical protein